MESRELYTQFVSKHLKGRENLGNQGAFSLSLSLDLQPFGLRSLYQFLNPIHSR
jgi:hypothetical protein